LRRLSTLISPKTTFNHAKLDRKYPSTNHELDYWSALITNCDA
jgi:hypothetical protein